MSQNSIDRNLNLRLDIKNDKDMCQQYSKKYASLNRMETRLMSRGGVDQWTRMRQDKLKSLKKVLISSYQSAIVQKYDVSNDSLVRNIIAIITIFQDQGQLSNNQLELLRSLEETYTFLMQNNRGSLEYINSLEEIVDSLVNQQPFFRCLINHDKLKVDYEDKIISIPFQEPPVGSKIPVETNFHNGTVFKWVHGNKEEWTPDTYWIVYMQYSQQTAYFRAEIRKADEQIEIITIDEEGNESSIIYRGWMTGPNETTALWNVKKGVVWNDMNYTKLLYITKDENTLAFFQRFDRIIINGKPWQVQAYNENYSTSKHNEGSSGIIRVALKETYTSTKQYMKAVAAQQIPQDEIDESVEPTIEGTTVASPYDVLTYAALGFDDYENNDWSISNSTLARIINISEDKKKVKVEILSETSNKEGFYINFGNDDSLKKHVIIKSL